MQHHLSCLLVAAFTSVASGCAHHYPPTTDPNDSPTYEVCRTIDVDTAFEKEQACPEWRKIGFAADPTGACPVPVDHEGHSWTVSSLFGTSPPSALPPALTPFCLYKTDATGDILTGLNANLQSLVAQGRLERVDSSCAAVSTAAQPRLVSATWKRYSQHFLAQAGQVDLTRLLPKCAGPSVRLAIVDTQPDGLVTKGNSEHGFTLANLARRLVCTGEPDDNPRCAADVTSSLALPIVDFDRNDPVKKTEMDETNGGFYGSVDRLAHAVWQELGRAVEDQRLVLNLSVAWDGTRFGGLEQRVRDMPVPVQALYRTLQVASCRGALVVAAAGNRQGGFDEAEGPLLPGGWERRDAPGDRACQRLDTERSREGSAYHRSDKPKKNREPLVYAVSGVRASGSPLANARAGSEPPRVAYGDHAVVESPAGTGPTAILTGSSVSTTVVSATAATVWHLRPDLSRSRLMELVYRSGKDLERNADFHNAPPQAPPGVRRIALCQAIASACRDGGLCADGPPDCRQAPLPRQLSTISSCQDTQNTVNLAAATETYKLIGEAPLCGPRKIFFDPDHGPPTDPCPGHQFFGVVARPWTHTQPGSNPCSACGDDEPENEGGGLVAGGRRGMSRAQPSDHATLHVEIDPGWTGGTLSEAFLDIGELSFALALPTLEAGSCATITGIERHLLKPSDDGLEPPVVLRFRVDSEPVASVEIPAFIDG